MPCPLRLSSTWFSIAESLCNLLWNETRRIDLITLCAPLTLAAFRRRSPKTFSEVALREVIDSIALHTGSLLEIVNYNVEVESLFIFNNVVANFFS
jgi:hypothetical protein